MATAWGLREAAAERPGPPQVVRPPVLLSDAVTPAGGETLLSLLLRRDLAAAAGRQDE